MFEGVTKYIPDLEEKKDPHRTISKIEDAVYSFVHNNPKWGLKYYRDIRPQGRSDCPCIYT